MGFPASIGKSRVSNTMPARFASVPGIANVRGSGSQPMWKIISDSLGEGGFIQHVCMLVCVCTYALYIYIHIYIYMCV